ncbi:peroxisomal membrane protein 11B-like [Eupeodes corollae]|uniref:peroxisomal membrane protein 11B-like n=1 Tax=Eupeodes corollae TaxID=290404 RepID=UPI002490FA24|nr:peroxisomal membrane protein 11B-like [Eupeodes corollae]
MDKWVALNSQTGWKDKVARLIQYLSRAIWDFLESRDSNPAVADQFKTLEYILSSFRKLLRFGKCLDLFYASLKTFHYPDAAIRVTLTLSKLSQALYLIADHLMWLSRTGLFKSINARKWSQTANKYWLLSITMNLCRDVYEILRLVDLHRAARKSGVANTRLSACIRSPRDFQRLALQSYGVLYGHRDVVVDTVKNVCDFFIPFAALGYANLSPRTIGLLGTISSMAGIMVMAEPSTQLLPS